MKPFLKIFSFLLVMSSVLPLQTSGQEDNPAGYISFSLKNIGFIRNKEYFNPSASGPLFLGTMYQPDRLFWYEGFGYVNPAIEGYTLIGDFIQPALIYNPYSGLSIKAGAYFLKYSGVGKFSEIKPVLSVKYSFSDRTSVTFGSLDGCENRQMMDPLFDFERMYINNSESGFEFISKQEHITNYTWLDWEHFIFTGDSERETINFGESFRYSTDKLLNNIELGIPVQLLIRHRGGQISNYAERMETYMDLGAGINVNYVVNSAKSQKLGLDLIHFIYYDNTPDRAILSFKQGYADWMKLHFNTNKLGVELAYFKSHNFYAPLGNLVYSSISGFTGRTILADRSLAAFSTSLYILKKRYMELYFGVDFYYDLNIKEMYNAAALHLKFNEAVKLFSLKR